MAQRDNSDSNRFYQSTAPVQNPRKVQIDGVNFASPQSIESITALDRRMVLGGLLVAGCQPAAAPEPPPVIPQREPSKAGLIELTRLDRTIRLDLRYATTNNFTHRILYAQARAFLVAAAADALIRAHKRALADGFGLTIFDAYRPWAVTKALWDATPRRDRNYVANPRKGSRHNRGCAVDLSLHDLNTGALIEMPTPFDDFSEKAHRDYAGASPTATANRARLETYMQGEGFTGLSNEWWHFDYRDWERYPVLDIAFEDL